MFYPFSFACYLQVENLNVLKHY